MAWQVLESWGLFASQRQAGTGRTGTPPTWKKITKKPHRKYKTRRRCQLEMLLMTRLVVFFYFISFYLPPHPSWFETAAEAVVTTEVRGSPKSTPGSSSWARPQPLSPLGEKKPNQTKQGNPPFFFNFQVHQPVGSQY